MNHTRNKPTARFFRKSRAELNLTQRKLSEILGTSRCSIAKYENGITVPTGNTILKLIALLEGR